MTLITNIRIVLVEPSGPLNVGAAARVMKNMGLSRLVIVNPRCDIGSTEAKQMAVHAGDVLAAAEQVETLSQALQGCQRVIATIGRDRAFPIPLEHPQVALPWLLETSDTALVFGREDRGLTNDELKYAQRLVQIPANPDYPSLNLAQSVAICCYELAVSTQRAADKEQQTENPLSSLHSLPSTLYPPPSTLHPGTSRWRLGWAPEQVFAGNSERIKDIAHDLRAI